MGRGTISKEITVIVVGLFIALTSYLLVKMGIIITSLAWLVCTAYLLSVACIYLYRRSINKNTQTEEGEEKSEKAAVLNFPNAPLLTTKDVMKEYGLSVNKLKQHIENGLHCYIKNPENEKLRPITERDLIALEVWSDESDSMIEQWLFKTEDVERYINKAVWLTGKEVIDKYNISAIELYQHIKNGLNVYPKDFSTVMLSGNVQPLSEYDIGFEIEYDIAHSDEAYNLIKDYHFKVCDIEKHI